MYTQNFTGDSKMILSQDKEKNKELLEIIEKGYHSFIDPDFENMSKEMEKTFKYIAEKEKEEFKIKTDEIAAYMELLIDYKELKEKILKDLEIWLKQYGPLECLPFYMIPWKSNIKKWKKNPRFWSIFLKKTYVLCKKYDPNFPKLTIKILDVFGKEKIYPVIVPIQTSAIKK